jgi:hypothetical protein
VHQQPAQQTDHSPYYLENFEVLADFVYSHYAHLLSPQEQDFYLTLKTLPQPARLLCIRLLMRRGDYVRRSRMHYPELEPVAVAIEQLLSNQLLEPAAAEQACDWLGLFSREELASVNAGDPAVDTESLATSDLLGNTPLGLLHCLDTVYRQTGKMHYRVFLLLFFGNLHQDLTEFVLRDLGIRQYETYLTDTSSLPFHSREQLLAYIHYYHCADEFDNAAEQGADALCALHQRLPCEHHDDPVLKRRTHQLYNKIARQLERESALDQAAVIYRQSHYPPARERLARIEEKRGNHREALELCQDILIHSSNSEEQAFAQRFEHKLATRLGIDSSAPTLYKPPLTEVALAPSSLPVEYAAALHFAKSGHCYYVENSLITAALGLTFWDVIFAPIPGAFFNPFQRAPSDFSDSQFSKRRQTLINDRMQAVAGGEMKAYLLKHYHTKRGLQNPLVSWSSIRYTLLTMAIRRIPDHHWLALFEYLLRDIKHHRSGLPDLIYFPNESGYRLLEVKGPGDALQPHQRRWMHHFHQHQIPHQLVNVTYARQATAVTAHASPMQAESLACE